MMRSLSEIETDIKEHEVAISKLKEEINEFRSKCPHPKDFYRVTYSQHRDEYGSPDGGTQTKECLMCGFKTYESVE